MTTTTSGGATVDWTRGLIIARGAAAGDLRAPGPQVARLAAERKARAAARQQLAAAAAHLPAGPGKQISEELIAELADRTIDLSIDHGSDGSVVAEVGLPIEAVRSELYGIAPMPKAAGDGPSAVLVDARAAVSRPLVGLTLIAGSETYQGPTVFARTVKSARADPRLGSEVATVKGTSLQAGELRLEERAAETLAAARSNGALVVVVVGSKSK